VLVTWHGLRIAGGEPLVRSLVFFAGEDFADEHLRQLAIAIAWNAGKTTYMEIVDPDALASWQQAQ
jgi:hypothetical protein